MAQYHAVTVLENPGLLQLDRGRLDQLPAVLDLVSNTRWFVAGTRAQL